MGRKMMKKEGRGSAKCRKSKTWGHNWHFGICLNKKKTKKRNSGCLLQIRKGEKREEERKLVQCPVADFHFFKSEKVRFLSRLLGDRTIEILQAKKQSYSMQRELRVGSGFMEFRQPS